MEYFLHILVLVGIYSTLAVSLDLVAGRAGLLSLAHAAFFGMGAYASALLTIHLEVPFLLGVVGGMVLAAVVSLLVSLPSMRLHDDYFVIATFGFQMILYSVFNNWISVSRGPLGIPGIPRPVIFGWHVDHNFEFALLAAVFAAFACIAVGLVVSSPFGRVLHAIREDEVVTQASGKNTLRFKITAFALSAALAGMAGSLYAHYITYIDPASFTVLESILILSMVIIGGAGSLWGPVVGAVVLATLPEALRFVGLSGALAANLRLIIYGALLVIMVMVRPQGLIGRYAFGASRGRSCP